MSVAPLRICATPGCSALVRTGRCQQHATQHVQAYDRQRGTAAQRGYNADWGRYRARFLEDYPFCGDKPDGARKTEDSQCATVGLLIKANVVDHIVPVTGPDDQTFYQPTAHQALCSRCHDVKRQREATAARSSLTGGR